jgi:hypothetical protein
MLEKNRAKRPNVEQVMDMAWFKEYSVKNSRGAGSPQNANKFKNYALTAPNDAKLDAEIKLVQQMQDEGK